MSEDKKAIGKYGEKLAKEYLKKMGYKIVETNFYCRYGEIDIIAQLEEEIIFVEVKTRKQEMYGNPAESVNQRKQNHIYKAAELYSYIYSLYSFSMSFDVVEVYILKDQEPRVVHMKNAILENPYKYFTRRI